MQPGSQTGATTSPPEPEPSEEERWFQELAGGPSFRKSPSIRALLLFLWRHRGSQLSEYSIATEALGRKADFDPRTDATVRVHVARLRQKLKEFYEGEGSDFPLRLSIPLGSHDLKAGPVPLLQPVPVRRALDLRWLWPGTALVFLLAATGLYLENRSLAEKLRQDTSSRALPRFWQNFTGNRKPTGLFLPTPVFYEWDQNETRLKIRDTLANEFTDYSRSAELLPFIKRWGTPRLMQNYTVTSDTFAAIKLAQYFERKGIPVTVGATADLDIESFGDRNIILIGTPATNSHIGRLMEKTHFYAIPGDSGAVRVHGSGTEAAERYAEVIHSDVRRTSPGIIAVLPGTANGTRVLMLTARFTAALVAFLIAPDSLDRMDKMWRKAGSPEYFEALVQTEQDKNTVLKAEPLIIRPIDLAAWEGASKQ